MIFAGYLAAAQGQVDGYASASYGFHKNPLYNYETVSDQVREGYVELNYTQPSVLNQFSLGYIGGLMIFNQLGDRNFYEHRLNLGYTMKLPAGVQNLPAATGSEGNEGEESEAPFRGKVFDIGLRLNARHDREIYRTFDNIGLEVPLAYTWGAGSGTEIKLANQAGVRRYFFLPELNNITDAVDGRLSMVLGNPTEITFIATTGLKHYTTEQIDTSQIETATTVAAQGNKGKGKGGTGSSGQGSGKKKVILVNSSTTTTYQVTLGAAATWRWENGTLGAEFLYRFNPEAQVRFLTQYANTSLLTQDIYNDSFNYGGPALKLALKERLPFDLFVTILAEAQRKKFLAPALDLAGLETSSNRVDLHGRLDGTVSKTFPLSEAVILEITFSGGIARNQSADAYNDYALSYWSLGFGIGF
jgi:hypothetical protein